jgi:hypothetical protein
VVTIAMATPMATFGPRGEEAQGKKRALTRTVDGGSKQTRTADPFLVREVL